MVRYQSFIVMLLTWGHQVVEIPRASMQINARCLSQMAACSGCILPHSTKANPLKFRKKGCFNTHTHTHTHTHKKMEKIFYTFLVDR